MILSGYQSAELKLDREKMDPRCRYFETAQKDFAGFALALRPIELERRA